MSLLCRATGNRVSSAPAPSSIHRSASSVEKQRLRAVATPPGAGLAQDPGGCRSVGRPGDLGSIRSRVPSCTRRLRSRRDTSQLTSLRGGHHAPLLGCERAQRGKRTTSQHGSSYHYRHTCVRLGGSVPRWPLSHHQPCHAAKIDDLRLPIAPIRKGCPRQADGAGRRPDGLLARRSWWGRVCRFLGGAKGYGG
jgi:hypothetical protein